MKSKFNIGKDLFYVLVMVLLLLINWYNMNNLNKTKQQLTNYENAIVALNDTIKHNIENGLDVYSKKTPEIYLNQLINSEYFKTMSKEQQNYYKELSKIKGLLSASNAKLEKQGFLLDQLLESQNPGLIKADSISFKLGQELLFKEKDTTKKLQWNSKITLDKNITFNMDYKYNVDILTTYERQKDKSILVKYKINDPELVVKDMQNYIIPPEQRKTKIGQWYDRNKKNIFLGGGTILFLGGGTLGYILAK